MPLIVLLFSIISFLALQNEISFFSGIFFYEYTFNFFSDGFFWFLNIFTSQTSLQIHEGLTFDFQKLNHMALEYNYNYRTYFSQTYLHAAYNKHMKPYRNLFNVEKMFGDYNSRTYGKSKKHARAMKHTRLFLLMYSHTLDCYALSPKTSSFSILFYFKRHHFYSLLEMFYASLYLGMIYFFSLTYTRMIEDGSLNMRETEEIDEEIAQNHWFFFREDRRGVIEPSIEDNEEVDFAYPQHPVEWDDNGSFYRWEMYFFIFLFSFLICWGVSQSAASMFYYDQFIDLHFMGWGTTFAFIFLFWRIFFLVQFFTYFNRFNIRRLVYLDFFLPFITLFFNFFFKLFYSYVWVFFYAVFSRFTKIFSVQSNNSVPLFDKSLFGIVKKETLKNLLIKFYRFIYSSFQKNLNFFEKRNIYDYMLSSNSTFLYNSRNHIDGVFYHSFFKDRFFSNIVSITSSYIDKYKLHNGFFFPKNMYLTTNKLSFPFTSFLPPIFPLYPDHFNVNDLPIWGADFFFNLNQNVFGVCESNESWFFSQRYHKKYRTLKILKEDFKNNINNNINTLLW